MTAPTTRGKAIAAYCRECIHDPAAEGTWREQAAVCAHTGCPLWRFRPLPAHAPAWLASRDPADLPAGFVSLPHAEAVAMLRGNIAANRHGCTAQSIGGARAAGGATTPQGATP